MKIPGRGLILPIAGALALGACSNTNQSRNPVPLTLESTSYEVSELLSSTGVVISGVPYILELYEPNPEFAINDSNCSIDPSTSFQDELPEVYDGDTVTACLYPQE